MDHALPIDAPSSPPMAMFVSAAFEAEAGRDGTERAGDRGPAAHERLGRCLALAEALRRRGWQTAMASGAAVLATTPARLINLSERLVVLQGAVADAGDALRQVCPAGVDLLVIDDADLAEAGIERSLRGWADCLLTIDHRLARTHAADLLLDETPLSVGTATAIRRLAPERTADGRVLAGAEFALLPRRASALRQRAVAERRRRTAARRVFVGFDDRLGAEPLIAALFALSLVPGRLQADVVLGPTVARVPGVHSLLQRLFGDACVHLEGEETIPLLAHADLAIGCASRFALLRCALGVPSIVVSEENQAETAAALDAAGACEHLGTFATLRESELARRVQAMISDHARRLAIAEAAARVCDGEGARRIVAALAPRLRTADGGRHPAALRCLAR